jgi:hypothetical protein
MQPEMTATSMGTVVLLLKEAMMNLLGAEV